MIWLLSIVWAFSWNVKEVKGPVVLYKKIVQQGDSLKAGDQLKSQVDSASIIVSDGNRTVKLKGRFQFKIPEKKSPSTFQLLYGKLVATVKGQSNKESKFKIRTKNAVVGVRGTKFWLSYNPTLNETETICFESKLFMQSGKKRVDINAGQWGGVGGRFGNVPKVIPKLPTSFIEKVETSI